MMPTVTSVRVRYVETDRMGVAHHTHFFSWFEVGRTELMRERGCPYRDLEERGTFFPVVEAGARYHRPARYDEEVQVETVLEQIAGARVRFSYEAHDPASGELLASGFTVHAAVDSAGRPRRVPADLLERLHSDGPDQPSGPDRPDRPDRSEQ